MNAVDLLNKQIELANTAHQREVRDLQAAGLNPILSANGSGAATPNILSGLEMSGANSSGSGRTSAKAIKAAADGSPINKSIELAGHAIDTIRKMATDDAIRLIKPENIRSAEEAANRNQQNFWNQFNRNQQSNQSANNSNVYQNQTSAGNLLFSDETDWNNSEAGQFMSDLINGIESLNIPVVGRTASGILRLLRGLSITGSNIRNRLFGK